MELAHVYQVGIPPPWWWEADDTTVATLLLLLGEDHDRQAEQNRKSKRR